MAPLVGGLVPLLLLFSDPRPRSLGGWTDSVRVAALLATVALLLATTPELRRLVLGRRVRATVRGALFLGTILYGMLAFEIALGALGMLALGLTWPPVDLATGSRRPRKRWDDR